MKGEPEIEREEPKKKKGSRRRCTCHARGKDRGSVEETGESEHPTIYAFSGLAPVYGHVDPHPSSNGPGLLAPVSQEGLEGLRHTANEGAQGYTALT